MSYTQPVLSLQLSLGSENFTVAINLSDEVVGIFQQRFVDEVQLGLIGGFDQTVSILRRREFRAQALVRSATNLGCKLAQLLQDKEGWHGKDRAEQLAGFGQDGRAR